MEKYREYLSELNDILLRNGIDLGIEKDLKQGTLERPRLILEQYFEFNKSLAVSDSEKAISIGTGEGNFLYNNLLYKKLQEEYEDTMKGALALLYSEVEDESPLTEEEIYQQRVDAFNAYLAESKELNAQRVPNEQEPDDSIVLFKDCKGYSGLSYTVDSVIEGASYEGNDLSYDEINAENGVGIDENGDIIDYDDGIYTEIVDGLEYESDEEEVDDTIPYGGTSDEDEEDDSLDYESVESDEEDDSFEYESDEPEGTDDFDEDYYDDAVGTDDLEEESDEEDLDEEDDFISLEEEDSEEEDDSVYLEEEDEDSEEEDDSYGDEDDSSEDEDDSLEDEDDSLEDYSIFSEDDDEDCEDEEIDEDSFTIEDEDTDSDEDEDEDSFDIEYDSTDSDEEDEEVDDSIDSDDDEGVDDSIDYENSGYDEEEEDDSILEDFSEEEEEEDDSLFSDEDEEDDTFPVLDDEVPPTPSPMVAPPPVPAEESMVRKTAVKRDSNDSFASFILGISDKVEKGGKALGKRCKDSHARVRDSK